jgi:hypothetical protein
MERRIALIRCAALAYWLVLSVILLVPHPAALFFDLRPARSVATLRGMHFSAFLALALLIQWARFRVGPRVQWAVLVGYAVLVESLQWFVPHRDVEFLDYMENLAGLLIGALLFALVGRRRNRCP